MLDPFVGGEAALACVTFAAPPGHRAPSGESRVDHAAVRAFTIRALHDSTRAQGGGQPSYFEKIRVALVPPNPKEFVIAYFNGRSRATKGTQSSWHSSS